MSVKKIFGIYGSGGFSREVMPVLLNMKGISINDTCYVVDEDFLPENEYINGSPVVLFKDFVSSDIKEKNITIAISNNEVRRDLYDKCTSNKINHHSIISNSSCIMDIVKVGDGSIICPFVTLTSNINIGKSFHANIYSYVAHDCQIGDYVTFAPAVKCNGNVIIENNVYIGTGAIIKQGTKNKPIVIGENSIIGAGSFVTKNVEKNTTVFGNPAKILNKKNFK